MADCTRCGRKLPLFSFGGSGHLCKECRAARAEFGLRDEESTPATRLASTTRWPPITSGLLALNVMVFLAMVYSGVSFSDPTGQQLVNFGANWGPLSLGLQPWRIFTCMFVHVGFLHLAFNMWCLWDLGILAERVFGGWAYLVTYLICGLSGSIASLAWDPRSPSAGASGAIFGIAGALIAVFYLGNLPLSKDAMQGTLKSLLVFAGYNLFFGAVMPHIDNSAHLGGLAAGLAIGAILAKSLDTPFRTRVFRETAVFVVAAGLLAGGFTLVRRARSYTMLMGLGVNSLDQGRTDEAIRSFEAVLAHNPRDPFALQVASQAYLKKKDYAKAASTLEQLLKLDPNDAVSQYNLGLAQLNLGRNQMAVESFEKAVQLDPKDADSQFMLGKAYQAAGKTSEAETAFQKANDLQKSAQPSK
jgi:membrane associated rhomboid family serine protease/cytochrome c-type biogenesis protein CcmH/NrfG